MKSTFCCPLLILLLLPACRTTAPDRFKQTDVNGDGVLTSAEISDGIVAGIFKERDTNSDGKIPLAEWNPASSALEKREFAARDANRDSVVTLAEAQAYARAKGTFAADAKAADANGDGQVTRAEAVAYYAGRE